jgi:beta-mannosidase
VTASLRLDEGWTVRAVAGPVPRHSAGRRIPATVPGSIHLDLLAAGLIPDPYLGLNEGRLGWIGRCGWRYEADVDWPGTAAERVELVADGLDTIAAIELNGSLVGHAANMHRGYRFDVRDLLRTGRNRLAVTFAAPLDAAEQAAARLGPRPGAYPLPTTPFARWPATSAGTGGRSWSPAGSGGRSGWRVGPGRGSPRYGR